MDRQEDNGRSPFQWTLVLATLIAVVVLVILYPHKFGSLLIALLGFSVVIVVHEFGHFIVAKLSGIKVEAFSIGFPPTLLAIRRKPAGGWRVRVLPGRDDEPAGTDQPGGGSTDAAEPPVAAGEPPRGTEPAAVVASDRVTTGPQPGETEYRLGLVPFGGFVKMLGQEDAGVAEKTDDPRSFSNKPILIRIAVVAAGVVFNAISASLIFMIVFLVGMDLPPAVVGGVMPGSPADRAGLEPGDRIVAVNGETFVDYSALLMAPALSRRGQPIELLVERPDGRREPVRIVAEQSPRSAQKLRILGIEQPESLRIPRKVDAKTRAELDKLGLAPGDRILAVDGRPVHAAWQMDEILHSALKDEIVLTVERTDPGTQVLSRVDVAIPMGWVAEYGHFSEETKLCHIHTLIPRLAVAAVEPPRLSPIGWLMRRFRKSGTAQADDRLQPGDVLLKIGDVENPTYTELRQVTEAHADKELAVTVLRKDDRGQEVEVDLTVTPKLDPKTKRVVIGFAPVLDVAHPVVAATVSSDDGNGNGGDGNGDLQPLSVPRGATITSVAGEAVTNWADVVRIYRAHHGQRITLAYRLEPGRVATVELDVPPDDRFLAARSGLAKPLPLEPLKECFKAATPWQAIHMGVKKTGMLIAQTYVTLQRLFTQDISPSNLMGPVGILQASYTIAQRSLIDYVYFLGLISSIIAVMNLLPLPIVDGGVIVLLLIERIKGSPLNERVQGAINYAGLAFLLAVFLWLTYQDLLRVWFG